ncbi:MAG: hypothetical protein DHS20C01_09020 [marine bacterium B5-7]|nr:MAG: hypothetical protein DHS20C01_09020 [marine bacterium B5-7]
MKIKNVGLLLIIASLVTTTGCASYRVSSNVDSEPTVDATSNSTTEFSPESTVIISEDSLPGRTYTEVGPIEVTVKKLTAFHKNPTREQANAALMDKARTIGADAVIDVTYKNGVGLTTWGYIKANGSGVKLTN